MLIAVSAHGVGNVRSVVRAIATVAPSAEIALTGDPDVVRRADRVVVPGQGSFGAFAAGMHGGLGDALKEAIRAGKPYLGICLGLQVLFDESDEAPGERGLSVLRGRVRRLEAGELPLPHIGWNEVAPAAAAAPLLGDAAAYYYFSNSFAAVPDDPSVVAATTSYGAPFASVVAKDNVVGVQFHPEKSQRDGLALLGRLLA